MQWVGIDVGGTFTDVVLYDEDRGTLTVGKSPTSPADPTLGLLAGLTKLHVALASTGRTFLSSGTGFAAQTIGWPLFFVATALAALPALALMAWLQGRGHFAPLDAERNGS